ncbi:MAG: molecular chaperone TorD family protein [Gammaproteobacteria bacterium]|nr:molecular chaperone TorD family protein [Gammaproteobacteria bacterium]
MPPGEPGAAEVRANVWYTLARALARPDTWPPDLDELLEGAFSPLGASLTDEVAAARAALAADGESPAVAHARLFIGPFEVKVAPWASSYLDPEGTLMGPYSQYAARSYAEAGLGPREGPVEAPDHITHELEFMYYLAFQEATTGEALWLERQQRFWREHLGQWLPRFADALVTHGEGTFYGHLGRLAGDFCRLQNTHLGAGRTLT